MSAPANKKARPRVNGSGRVGGLGQDRWKVAAAPRRTGPRQFPRGWDRQAGSQGPFDGGSARDVPEAPRLS